MRNHLFLMGKPSNWPWAHAMVMYPLAWYLCVLNNRCTAHNLRRDERRKFLGEDRGRAKKLFQIESSEGKLQVCTGPWCCFLVSRHIPVHGYTLCGLRIGEDPGLQWPQVIFEGVFPWMGVPQNGWFGKEDPIKMDDLGVPPFVETPIWVWGLWGKSRRTPPHGMSACQEKTCVSGPRNTMKYPHHADSRSTVSCASSFFHISLVYHPKKI